jgi:hypothetical protein
VNAKRTIQTIAFLGVALMTAVAGCATSVDGGGGNGTGPGTGGSTCNAIFSGSACLDGCSGAEQACSSAGQSGAFSTFLSCASNAGFTCDSSGQVSINGGNCTNEAAAIAGCVGGGMMSSDAGPNPTSTNPTPTGTGTTPPPGKDGGAKDSGASNPPPGSDASDPCTACQTTATNTGGQCYSSVTACENDSACNTLLTCINNCTNATCENTCATTAGMTAVNELNAVDTCICNTACPSQCAADCSSGPADSGTGPVDSGSPPPQDSGSGGTCTTCATTAQNAGGKCYTDVTACMNDQSCVTLVNCLNACSPSDMTCANNCGNAASQSAITEYNNLSNCICQTACATPCASECGP